MKTRPYIRLLAGSLATLIVSSAMALAAPPTESSKQPSQDCSVALFSGSAQDVARVCDLNHIRKLASKGSVFEQNQMGIATMLAVSPDSSLKEAVEWFQKAARRGYAPAQLNLGVMYANGWGVRRNDGAALHWLRAAADAGSARASYNLGLLYMKGQGVRQDYKHALRYFERGAQACDTGAQTNLAYLYDRGLGVAADPQLAATWYRKAAEQGDAMAQHNLGDMYLRGDGVGPDDARAIALFEQAAVQGHTGAQIKLGYMLSEGRGTKKDVQAGYRWIKTASVAGDARGDYLLPAIKAQLTPEQIREAEHPGRVSATTQDSPADSFMKLAALETGNGVARTCSGK